MTDKNTDTDEAKVNEDSDSDSPTSIDANNATESNENELSGSGEATSEAGPVEVGEDSASEAASATSEKEVEIAPQKKPAEAPNRVEPNKNGGMRTVISMIFALICALAVGVGIWYWANTKFVGLQEKIDSSFEADTENAARMNSVGEQADTLNSELSQLQAESNRLKNQVEYLQQKVDSQNLRILSMSTTSRDDWLLAEAEYLLKLANQRILVERNAETAVGLLEEADAILRDMADPDLFPIRKAMKADLVALKLAGKIDIEGLYLELSALSDSVAAMPLVPESFKFDQSDEPEPSVETMEKSTLNKFFDAFTSYVRVIDHNDKPEAILPPDATKYLHLNLQFMLERAQIALLREQQDVYSENLVRSKKWVRQYFPNSTQANEFVSQLDELSTKNIVVTLPDISNSLELLHGYIATLHALGDATRSSATDSNVEGSDVQPSSAPSPASSESPTASDESVESEPASGEPTSTVEAI